LRDQLELTRIDQRGDLPQVPIFAAFELAYAQLARASVLIGAQGGALATLQPQAGRAALPFPLRAHEHALRRDDALQLGVDDRQAAALDDFTFDVSSAEGFLVAVTLSIAIVE